MRYLTIIFCAVLVILSVYQAQAEVPKLINYQGKLTTAEGACVDTTVSMQFSIYSDSTGGDPLWTETQTSVKVDKGIFNVLLGSVNEIPESVFTGAIRYLGVKVGDDPEMIPRKAMVSVGYAYNSAMLEGKHADELPINPSRVYDSGWFPVETSHNYTLIHNLGTTRIIAELWFSTSSDGSSALRVNTMERANDQGTTACLYGLSTTHISIRTGLGYLAVYYDATGWVSFYSSGYYRLILLALE